MSCVFCRHSCRAGDSLLVVRCGHFRLTLCISHRFNKVNGPMTLVFVYFQRVSLSCLANCSADFDRGCSTFQRRMVDVMCCITFAAIGTSEANASGLNHLHEKVRVINAVFWHVFRVIWIGDVISDMCDKRAQVSRMRPSLLHCAARESLFCSIC